MTTWRQLYDEARERLGDIDARRIVERASGHEGAEFHVRLDESVPERAVPFYERMVERRATGEPLQYVIGQWGFRTLDLYIDRRVLIPRPETEGVVDIAMVELGKLAPEPPQIIVDLGTGSGAIALSFAKEVPTAEVYGVDASADALAVASANLAGLGRDATRVRLLQGSWFEPLSPFLEGRVHLIVANPPYIGDDEELPPDVNDWEPRAALRGGATGFEQIEHIVTEAPRWLTRPGVLVVEMAPHQVLQAGRLAYDVGFAEVEVRPDLAGLDRAIVARV